MGGAPSCACGALQGRQKRKAEAFEALHAICRLAESARIGLPVIGRVPEKALFE